MRMQRRHQVVVDVMRVVRMQFRIPRQRRQGLVRMHVVQSAVPMRNGRGGRSGRVLLIHRQAHVLPHFPLGLPAPEVAFLEIVHVGRMNGPIMSFAFMTSTENSIKLTAIQSNQPQFIP